MSPLFFRILVFSFGLFFSTAAVSPASAAIGKKNAPASGTGKNTINFQRTKTRIDALLAQRLKPEPLPDTLPNPFQLTEIAPPVTREKDSKPVVT
jgi:hypothetical protein